MKKSKLIALSASITSLAVVILCFGGLISVFEYASLMLSSICIMVFVSKNSLIGGLMTYIATAILTAILIGGASFQIVLPFILFFGLHPLAIEFFNKKGIKKPIAIAIRCVWFVLSMLVVTIFYENFFVVENETLQKYTHLLIVVGGGLLFIPYDFYMQKAQRMVNMIIKRLKL